MLTPLEKLLFIGLLTASAGWSFVTFRRMVRVIRRGQGQLHFDRLPLRVLDGLFLFVFQSPLLLRRPIVALFHYAVSWGFICYLLANVVDIIEAWVPGYQFLHGHSLGGPYRLGVDLFSVAIIVAVTGFLVRRFVVGGNPFSVRGNVILIPEAEAGIARDSLIVGGFILGHVGFRIAAASFHISQAGPDAWQPMAGLLSTLWNGWPEAALSAGFHASWWVAIGLILAFVPYFPYSKHAHLFMGPFNVATRPRRTSPGILDPLDFEDTSADRFGAESLTDLNRTHIVDAFACIMCNRCQDVCPPYATGKELSPAALEINKRFFLNKNLKELSSGGADGSSLLGELISGSAVWSCLGCGACEDVCPVGNEPMHDIMDIRRNEVLMKSQFPVELKNAFTGLERNANPWQMSEDRTAWTQGLDFHLPTVAENPDYDVLYWVGCAGAFDPRARQTAQATATLLHKAGVNVAILGNDEACTGDLARRTGNEYLFHELATGNIQTLKGAGADTKEVVAGCPHCVHTLKNEYPALGGNFAVSHHSQFLENLVKEGKLEVSGTAAGTVTFHDPCYLGRQNGVYDAPRQVLQASGTSQVEMGRSRRNSFCCGGGGGQVWKEEEAGDQAVSDNRYAEAQATGAETLAVGCPFCSRMLSDANDRSGGGKMQVKDIAEVLLEATTI